MISIYCEPGPGGAIFCLAGGPASAAAPTQPGVVQQVPAHPAGYAETPEVTGPTCNGDSIGHWEGDTLVVETISLRDENNFNETDETGGATCGR